MIRYHEAGGSRSEVGGRSSRSRSGGNGSAKIIPPVTAVIDLSSPSWDDDPFLDSLASEQQNAEKSNGRSSTSTNRKSNKMVNSNASSNGSSGTAAGRRRPAAPLTSISALFGGGGAGNRANRAR